MANWYSRISGSGHSARKAKERLKLVLIHDRTDMTPESLNQLKEELLEVISRHVAIDPNGVKIKVTQDGREQRLVADIPLLAINQRKY
jgi:cell division topological specificity factor